MSTVAHSGRTTVPDAVERTRFEARAMGSPLRLTIGRDAMDSGDAVKSWALVVDEFAAAEAAMSRFRGDSELTRVNQAAGSGMPVRPSIRLRRALVAADRAHRISNGRFDPRILVDLDRLGYRGAPLGADATRPGRTRPADVDAPVVRRVDRDRVLVDRPVDLGGIGKGLTLRWAADRLLVHGVANALLEAGGDLVALGVGPDGGPWHLGIEDPTDRDEPLAVIAVEGLAVATSSTRIHRWDVDGRTIHHLLDPSTGEPSDRGLTAVTVAGPDAAWAEVWSKVLFLGGRTTIASEARSRGLAAWWVAVDGTLEMTAAARAHTIWVAVEARA